MAYQQVMSVFCYAFRPLMPMNDRDGGFTVNLLSNDMLCFNTYDANGRIIGAQSFQLKGYTRERYLRMVEYSRPWLNNMPARMRDDEGRLEGEYTFGFHGMPLFRIENLQSLINGDFRDRSCHYARKVYCLLEDVSALLHAYGIELGPVSFNWDSRVISPVIPAQTAYSNLA